MINGDDLKAMRLKAGIAQKNMATKLNLESKTIIDYELNVIKVRGRDLFFWLYYCKVDVSVVFRQIKAVREQVNGNKTGESIIKGDEE
ncbi:XRE family transcriptional regulator [Pseudoalteromonas umbrosa]|uniref:XRE family transcriptional regulator n=1 Tax=Pseudoalteromonas umbrosa TaxID=3048489 RepID=UPI0024C3B39C|nr:XRE family transcriptional regulator [Pseudoalteromonas sp. B95]MDK1288605.1 XRE family transcriptional regulator [Pseudoalteromonas sp. B95]